MKRLRLVTVSILAIICLFAVQILQDWLYNNANIKSIITERQGPISITVIKGTTRIIQTTKSWPKKQHTIAQSKKSTFVSSSKVSPSLNDSLHKIPLKAPPINKSLRYKTKITKSSKHLNPNTILNSIKLIPIVKKENVTRILLVTYFRSGSTFLGDILQQNWRTFYHYEPLHYMARNSKITANQTREALDLMSFLFRCNFAKAEKYMKWASHRRRQFLFQRNRFLWSVCHTHRNSCFSFQYLFEICLRATVHVMKVTRIHLGDAIKFIQENPDLNIKLIYLSRDPRAIISSRKVLDWCQNDGCNDPSNLCKDMTADVEELHKIDMQNQWLRYEDLAMNTLNITRDLYKRLSIPYTSAVVTFLVSHTHARSTDANDPYSTRRNSTTTPFEWLHRLSFEEIIQIQSKCKNVIESLGYKTISNDISHDYGNPDSVLNRTIYI